MEKIKHPSHYAEGRKYEPYKVIKDWDLNFNLGNAVKYISRAGRKDNVVVDLKKAIEYIQFEIEAIEGEQEKAPEPAKDFYEDNCCGCGECGCHRESNEEEDKDYKQFREATDNIFGDMFKPSKHSEPVEIKISVEGGYIPTKCIDEVVSNIADRIRKSLKKRAGMRDEDN
ncbi:hypothetical protein C3V36_10990 [Lachnospiraceae bacterium oral taxon 500]|nr:hypothetical protein C3V36_10990 [Lachnospiraceae bacterium oral taxon 500]